MTEVCPQLRPRWQKVPDRDRRNRQVDHPLAKDQRGPPRHRPQPPPRQRQGSGRHNQKTHAREPHHESQVRRVERQRLSTLDASTSIVSITT